MPCLLEQCQVVVFVADDLGLLRPETSDLLAELCPSQGTAQMLTQAMYKAGVPRPPQSSCRSGWNPRHQKYQVRNVQIRNLAVLDFQ